VSVEGARCLAGRTDRRVLCPGVSIGENALVGAGSVVTRDVPDRIIVAGNSSRHFGTAPAEQII